MDKLLRARLYIPIIRTGRQAGRQGSRQAGRKAGRQAGMWGGWILLSADWRNPSFLYYSPHPTVYFVQRVR